MIPNLSSKVAFCVGATSGIGRAVATRLAQMNVSVGIAARNKQVGDELVKELRSINPKGKYEIITCEATSMKSINQACTEFGQIYDKLNYCVMTQGTASLDPRNETSEGIDKKMALNYYGRVQCINSLESLLRKTASTEDVRVMSIFSGGVHSAYDNLNDLPLKKSYTLPNAANAAGFYTDLAFDQLSRDYVNSQISFVHAAPGYVRTSFSKNLPFPLSQLANLAGYFAMSPEECAKVMIDNGLLGSHMGVTSDGRAGFHLMTRKGAEAKRTSLHNDLYREAVWKHTKETLRDAVK